MKPLRPFVTLLVALPGCAEAPAYTLRETAGLRVPRAVHTATALSGGRVLLAGGCVTDGCGTATATTEMYNARTARFTAGPRLTGPRDGHAAVRLLDDRVLLIGGYAGEGQGALATAELCDRARCRTTGALATPRGGHAAVRLRDGRVLVIGGDGALGSTEVWAYGSFRPGPPLAHPRHSHTATVLHDGRVLVVGGYDAEGQAIAATEMLGGQTPVRAPEQGSDPGSGALTTARGKHAAVALPDGRVLVIGGSRDAETRDRLASTEVYDPRTGRFAPGPDLQSARYKLPAAAAVLPDGRVLVAGDSAAPEIVDVRRGRSVVVPGSVAGAFATATALGGGRTLIAGGYDDRIAISGAAFVAGRSR